MDKIILLEDDLSVARSFARILEQEGYQVTKAANYIEFKKVYEEFNPDVILLDIELKNSEKNGLEIFDEYRLKEDFSAKVVVLSAKASLTQVAEAMKMGAVNFIEKSPFFKKDKFLADVHQAMELSRSQHEIDNLRLTSLDIALVGESEAMRRIKRKILKLGKSDLNVLLTGETGTGKGVVAEMIHINSNRKSKPFKVVDVKSIPDNLVESELFGHTKGAFTGADRAKKGYFENAHKGTLFMDEIANLSLGEQAKILKVIEEKKITIVGTGGRDLDVDVRIIAASNQDLAEMSASGDFRDDLYFRFSVGSIEIPPLRERDGDILLLLNRFLLDKARENSNSLDIDLQSIETALTDYPWPGNVREIKNFATFISQLYDRVDNQVIMKEFELHRKRNHKLANMSRESVKENELEEIMMNKDYKLSMDLLEIKYLETQLELNGGNVSKTAKSIGLDRTTLHKKIKKFGIGEE